jgi:hypothetical protein
MLCLHTMGYLFIYFGGTAVWTPGFWTQGFALAKQTLYCLIHTSTSFFLGYFGDGVLLSTWTGLDLNPPNLGVSHILGWQAPASLPSYWLR